MNFHRHRECLHTSIEVLESRIAPATFAAVVDLADLQAPEGFRIDGQVSGDALGFAVSDAGDVNGDGFDDVLIGALRDNPDGTDSGIIYVVFGHDGDFMNALELSSLDGTNGFKVNDAGPYFAMSGAGDINGDGFDDLIIGSSHKAGVGYSGAAYVLFGHAGSFTPMLELSNLKPRDGFMITAAPGSYIGYAVSGPGDINADGFDDLVFTTPYSIPDGEHGAAFVLFGHSGAFATTFDVSNLDGTNGFKIPSEAAGVELGNAADVNGDGIADLIIGTAGSIYVVFGHRDSFDATFQVSSLDGTNGFRLDGEATEYPGSALAAGDVNGDGFDDVIVGARGGNSVYVVFGHSGPFASTLSLANLSGENGFKAFYNPGDHYSEFGITVSAGDINGDHFDDVVVGTTGRPNGGPTEVFVIFGHGDGFAANIDVSGLNGTNGFKIIGTGRSISHVNSAADLNGDGFDDLLIGRAAFGNAGTSYVLFGHGNLTPSFGPDGKTATFMDTDGDIVTVRTTRGTLSLPDFVIAHPPGAKAGTALLNLLDVSRAEFAGATITITSTTPVGGGGDGRVNVGHIDAHGIDLDRVIVDGDLGQIDAGDDDSSTPALNLLKVKSLGKRIDTQLIDTVQPLQSDIVGALGALEISGGMKGVISIVGGTEGRIGVVTIGGDLSGIDGGATAGLIRSEGSITSITIGGSIIGGAKLSGIVSGRKIGSLKIGHQLCSADPTKPVIISALGKFGAGTLAQAVAIGEIHVGGKVLNARILAGYNTAGLALNGDAGIGTVVVSGKWSASSLAAGVLDSGDGFGRNDRRIALGVESIVATIASIEIKGFAEGSAATRDFFGITAESIGKARIAGVALALTAGKDKFRLDPANKDFRLVEV